MGKFDWKTLLPFRSNPITAIADAGGKIADAANGIVVSGSRQEQTTRRQKIDMASDNKLSKSIRPVVMLWAMALFTLMVLLDLFGHPVGSDYKSTINLILGLTVGFYFPGRTLEKFLGRKTRQRASNNLNSNS